VISHKHHHRQQQRDSADRLVLPLQKRLRALANRVRDRLHLGRSRVGRNDRPSHRKRHHQRQQRHSNRNPKVKSSIVRIGTRSASLKNEKSREVYSLHERISW
jgi:hypothetical protein